MKQLSSLAAVLRLATCILLIASATQKVDARDNNSSNRNDAISANSGRLFIKRSPVLGLDVVVAITIDGKPAGTLVRARAFDKDITPGRHTITLAHYPGDAWQATLDVRPGQTHSYSVAFNGNRLVLTPVTPPR